MTKDGTVHSPRSAHRRWRGAALVLSSVAAVLMAACSSASTAGGAGSSAPAVVPEMKLERESVRSI